MDKVKLEHRPDLDKLDKLGEEAVQSPRRMDLIVNGATLMSVKKDTLRGVIRVLLTGAGAQIVKLLAQFHDVEAENAQLREVITANDPQFFTRKCRVCGCDWNHACPGGCSWVEDDLCSACAPKVMAQSISRAFGVEPGSEA